MDVRQQLLQTWVHQSLKDMNLSQPQGSLTTVSGDASFRRYFRQAVTDGSYIAVDAPPDKEDNPIFVHIAQAWYEQGIAVPKVIHADFEQGFMLLSDMGDQLLLPLLNENSADDLYGQAMDALITIASSDHKLPPYDEALLDREMALFRDWFLLEHLQFDLTNNDERILRDTFELLRESALGQIQVPVHRDYHSRNLMVLENGSLGIIDFQDAVQGAITYDLVSLLRDCYISWPLEKVHDWVREYFKKAKQAGIIGAISEQQFILWFDWMGLQRHIKVAGIFARLAIRDGKQDYLKDIPLTLSYILSVSGEYEALTEFHQWFKNRLLPQVNMALPQLGDAS
jgi:aminoglycoside/choline kinase family phosphotransferase